ncbi:MAG: 2OG-Fe(II) oxygenase family protein [Alphaproteobacteria bacterium]|nr:2OG-Fe(II) oxygenase family protein [Alphaproteobacteria bacterium]
MSQPQLQLDVQPLFATPVAVVIHPDAIRLNAALKTAILNQEQAAPSTQHSNLGGWQSTWDMESWGGQATQDLIQSAKAIASKLTARRDGQPMGQVDWAVNIWANVNRSGHGNEFHTHPGAMWSCVYYVDDGGVGRNPALGGEFEMQDPRGVAPAMYAPEISFAGPGGTSMGASEVLRPQAGMLVMFPSWLSHGVRPYHGNAARISVALNLGLNRR